MDQLIKRQNLARKLIAAATALIDARTTLNESAEERIQAGNFLDSDFSGVPDLQHLDAGMIGTLCDFVITSIEANIEDVVNGGRNKQILLQVRK